jgi:hypothetical protein
MHKNVHSYQALLLAISLILGGCAGDPVTLGSAQHDQLLLQDRAAAEQGQMVQISLTERPSGVELSAILMRVWLLWRFLSLKGRLRLMK